MNSEQVNELLKARIGFSNNKEIDDYRAIYLKATTTPSEEDFYWSMRNWWDDGNAPYYDSWLERNWRDK